MLPQSYIKSVKFAPLSSEEIEKQAYVMVENAELFNDNIPVEFGVHDPRMGVDDSAYNCKTCFLGKSQCLGHRGALRLAQPVWAPLVFSETLNWLRIICFNCSKPFIDISGAREKFGKKALQEVSKLARNITRKNCIHCQTPHPKIKIDSSQPLTVQLVGDTLQAKAIILHPKKAQEILSQISNETLYSLNKTPEVHPKKFILNSIIVPPVNIRPDTPPQGTMRPTNDPLTTGFQYIVKLNTKLRETAGEVNDREIAELCHAVWDVVKSKSGDRPKSIGERIKGKKGRVRDQQLGKRLRLMARSTITGDPSLLMDEVGIPMFIARKLWMREKVQEYNLTRALQYVRNAPGIYPCAHMVIKSGAKTPYEVNENTQIQVGDVIYRDLIDGDIVLFNRQPSLMASNITAERVRVRRNLKHYELSMNPDKTKAYNADFDGDQMNTMGTDERTASVEISIVSSIDNFVINLSNSSPLLGQVDDSIIGMAELTRNGIYFNKYHAMLLFNNTGLMPQIPEKLSGRDALSIALQVAPIDYKGKAEYYKESMAPYLKYNNEEINVVIKHGRIYQGIIDKKAIGAGSPGNLYHRIALEHGPRKMLDVMFSTQQIALAYLGIRGFTIGIGDAMVSPEVRQNLDTITSDLINKSLLVVEDLHSGRIIPPIDKTVSQFYEEQQISKLTVMDDFVAPVLSGIRQENNLLRLIMVGSKGKIDQLHNIVSSNGQKLINGARIAKTFGFERTSPYTRRFDESPDSRGFIANSYLQGMSLNEYATNAQASRFDLISKALSTSVTGDQNRKSIKNLESNIIDNFRRTSKYGAIIQFAYGEDYSDPRYVEKATFPIASMSDVEFQKILPEDFPQYKLKMIEDRNHYRGVFLRLERTEVKELISSERRAPLSVLRIMDGVRSHFEHENGSIPNSDGKDINEKVQKVEEFIEELPYIFMNEHARLRKAPVPEYAKTATRLVAIQIRYELRPGNIINMPANLLDLILIAIKARYKSVLVSPGWAAGIIAAQSFSEPLTQYMLDAHHRSASGGTSKSSMTSTMEVLSARETSKLKSPTMTIALKSPYNSSESQAQDCANFIEMMKFKQFVGTYQIFYEKFGEPVHPNFVGEKDEIAQFVQKNEGIYEKPNNLTRWCMRFVIDKQALVLKSMDVRTIILKLRDLFENIYFVYNDENSNICFIRACLTATGDYKNTLDYVFGVMESILESTIRGVEGVLTARVFKMLRSKIDENGTIVRDNDCYAIRTTGTNFAGAISLPFVDPYNSMSSALHEMSNILGIEAARLRIMSELKSIVDSCGFHHLQIYADEMTYTGRLTSIERSGLKTRENNNILLRIGFDSPMSALEDAVANGTSDAVSGVTAPLLVGSVPRVGTYYNQVYTDPKFVQQHVQRPGDFLEALYV